MTLTPAPIGITLFRRPEYTHRVLTALAECYGVRERPILISIDHDNFYTKEIGEVLALALDFAEHFPRAAVTAQVSSLGIDVHKEWLIPRLLEVGDRFIFLEDDTAPAKDALHFLDWALDTYRDDPSVMSVCGYRKVPALDPMQLGRCYRQPSFVPWGWGMWADRWETIWRDGTPYRDQLDAWYGDRNPNGYFDYWWKTYAETHNLTTIFPNVPRVFNFGREHGEHTIPKIFDATDYNPLGAWMLEKLPDRLVWVEGDE
jgi:hypothetical protein